QDLSLTLHPENARDLILAQTGVTTDRGPGAGGAIPVPPSFRWRNLEPLVPTRSALGWLGGLALQGYDAIANAAAGLFKQQATGMAQKRLREQIISHFDQPATPKEGLYALAPDSLPTNFDPNRKVQQIAAETNAKMLVLVHGTFSSTSGTFGKLWAE